jgi:hypothetical protein
VIKEGNAPLPSVKANIPSNKDDPKTTTTHGSAGDTEAAQPILVSDDCRNETSLTSHTLENQQKMVSSRLAAICNNRLQDGLDPQTIAFLNKKTRESTQKMYDKSWHRWESWCIDQQP